jgi:phage/plasmid-like protein (TIGR03299 family)
MKAANVDWEVEKVPAFAEIGGKTVDIGRSALVRSTDNKILDVVTPDWEPLQNAEAFDFFNQYIEAGDMEMDTAGSLDGGRIVWALAKTKESFTLFNGDSVKAYLLFSNPHKFGKSIDVRFTSIRTVCQNTMTLALNEKAKVGARVTHRVKFDAEAVKETMGIVSNHTSRLEEAASFLSQKQYDKENIVEYFQRIFPVLSNKEQGAKELSKNAKIALEILEQQPGFDLSPGSWWQSVNAVTFMTNHVLGRSQDRRVQSTFYGSNQKLNTKALNLALELAS